MYYEVKLLVSVSYIMRLNSSYTLLQCDVHTVLQCYSVTVQCAHCYSVTLLQCDVYTVLQCHFSWYKHSAWQVHLWSCWNWSYIYIYGHIYIYICTHFLDIEENWNFHVPDVNYGFSAVWRSILNLCICPKHDANYKAIPKYRISVNWSNWQGLQMFNYNYNF